MKHIKEQPSVTFTNVFGYPIDERGHSEADHRTWILNLELAGTSEKLLKQVRDWAPRVMTFTEFVQTRLLEPKFTADLPGQNVGHEIQIALREMKKTGWLSLVDDHYEQLSKVTDKPSEKMVYNNTISHVFRPFGNAIVKQAIDELPPVEVRSGPNGTAAMGEILSSPGVPA